MAIMFNDDDYKEEISGEVANVTYGNKKTYADELPEEITPEIAKAVFAYSGDYIDASVAAATDISVKILKENPGVKKVISHYPFGPTGTGSVDIVEDRSKDIRTPGTDTVITRPDIRVAVKHTNLKATKSKIVSLRAMMQEKL